MQPLARASLVLAFCSAAWGINLRSGGQDPKGPGQAEPTMDGACAECNKHAEYLDREDPCVCHATDVMGTFANDATKELTTRKGYGFETTNTGKERLPEGWMWHCRPVSATEGLWKQCPAAPAAP